MVSYKDLGLVNTREMFAKAIEGGYAIPAYNFNNMEQLQAIIAACVETSSPVILQVSAGARKYANQTLLRYMAQGAVEYAKELGKNIPIALHLDHGNSFELCKSCIDMGFSSVMIDGSHLPYDENVALTKQVVEYAHQHDVTVEGELGVLAGIEDDVVAEHHTYTDPNDVIDFVQKTGVDRALGGHTKRVRQSACGCVSRGDGMAWGGGLWPGQIPVVSGLCSAAPPPFYCHLFRRCNFSGASSCQSLNRDVPYLASCISELKVLVA